METIKLNYGWNLPKNYTGMFEYPNGTIEYYLNGLIHREDGPAIIWKDGKVFYLIDDKDITEEVIDWIIENNIPEVWNNSHKILFKLTFG